MSTMVNAVLTGSAPGATTMDHFLPVYSGKSLFTLCMERNAPYASRQIIIGHNEFYLKAKECLKRSGNKSALSIIEEDQLTNLYSAAFAAFSSGGDEIILTTPSHYMISDSPNYRTAVEELFQVALHGGIGVLSFPADGMAENFALITRKGDQVASIRFPKDEEALQARVKNADQVLHSGIYCCKASVYLKELKALAPDIFKAAQSIWKSRVGLYVAAEGRVKVPAVTIEDTLLIHSSLVKVVVQKGPRLQIPLKKASDKNDSDQDNAAGHSRNGGLHMIGAAV